MGLEHIRRAGVIQLAIRMHTFSSWQFPWESGAASDCQKCDSTTETGLTVDWALEAHGIERECASNPLYPY